MNPRRPRPFHRLAAAATALLGASGCGGGPARDGVTAAPDAAGEAVARVARCAAPPAGAAAGVRTRLDLPFAAAGGDTLRLDLAQPAGAGPHPVVLLLHGGGWEGGDRRAMHDEMRLLAAHGYAAAAVSYRLTRAPVDVFPAAVHDARCAVRWLRAEATALGLDGARIGALGFSAGAHLASLLGTAAGATALDAPVGRDGRPAAGGGAGAWRCLAGGDASPAVQAVVAVGGPQDLRVDGPYTAEQARLVTNFLGAFPGDAPALAALASPITHVDARSAPFLLVHGTRDDLVPVAHARRMRDALRARGVPATLVEERAMGHAFPALGGAAGGAPTAMGCTVLAFWDRWLRPR